MKINKTNTYRAIILYSIFGLILVGAIYLLSPLNRIASINISGNHYTEEETIVEQSTLNIGDELWANLLREDNITNRIVNGSPEIKSADMSLRYPNHIELTIKEYEIVANLKTAGEEQYLAALSNGELFHSEKAPYVDKPVLVDFETGELLTDLIAELADVNVEVLQLMSDIKLLDSERNPQLISISMNDGNQVLASISSVSERINLYPSLVAEVDGQTGVFDLEAGAYFIPGATIESLDYEQERSADESLEVGEDSNPSEESVEANEPENVTES